MAYLRSESTVAQRSAVCLSTEWPGLESWHVGLGIDGQRGVERSSDENQKHKKRRGPVKDISNTLARHKHVHYVTLEKPSIITHTRSCASQCA